MRYLLHKYLPVITYHKKDYHASLSWEYHPMYFNIGLTFKYVEEPLNEFFDCYLCIVPAFPIHLSVAAYKY